MSTRPATLSIFVVKATVQSMINRGLKARKSIFF
jgi:hypothetical protein